MAKACLGLITFSALFISCAPETGLTNQEVIDITALVQRATTNKVTGLQRQPSGEVAVWTVALPGGTNGVTYTLRQKSTGWEIVSQKAE